MTIQELIDKIEEIRNTAKYNDPDEQEKTLEAIVRQCDRILLDWKMENAKCLKAGIIK